MDLSSLPFLFIFLPIFLLLYWLASPRWRLILIVISSLLFSILAQVYGFLWVGGLILIGDFLGRAIEVYKGQKHIARSWLWLGIVLSLLVLAFFKGAGHQVISLINRYTVLSFSESLLPIGLSYISIQVIGYWVDIWRGVIPAERNLARLGAYFLFFPRLVAGPFIRYKDFASQINHLAPDVEDMAAGVRRLLTGFCKRLLLANQLALVVNAVFNMPTANVPPFWAWLALIAYALQIYFDFSGYTDMALGLGQMMGIRLPENFNNPYLAQSISDFWRRWHMSLSGWFREYVFFPLERLRIPIGGQQLSIMIVFLLTGLWHGISWPFIIWGLIHGVAVAAESAGLGRWLKTVWAPVRHIYVVIVVLVGWVFFRSNSLLFAFDFFGRLAGNTQGLTPLVFSETAPLPFIEPSFVLVLCISVLLVLPAGPLWHRLYKAMTDAQPKITGGLQILQDVVLTGLFIVGLAAYWSGSFIPNIYGGF